MTVLNIFKMHLSCSVFAATLLLSLSSLSHAQTTDEFTVSCNTLTTQRSDPIFNPGEVSGHVHVVVGGTAFQREMDQDTAKNSMSTTCDKDIDKSSYWVPQLYHQTEYGKFEMVQNQGSVRWPHSLGITSNSDLFFLSRLSTISTERATIQPVPLDATMTKTRLSHWHLPRAYGW